MLNSYDLAKIFGFTADHCREIIKKVKEKHGLTYTEKCISIDLYCQDYNISPETIWACLENRK